MGIHCIRIEAGLSHVLTYNTSKQADLRWKFKSDGGDLFFGVEVKRDNKISVLVPSARVPSHKEVQAGVVEFSAKDMIMVHLDNTHSRFTSKVVTYSIIVEPQKQSNHSELGIETLVKSIRSGPDNADKSEKNNLKPSVKKSKKSLKKKKSLKI